MTSVIVLGKFTKISLTDAWPTEDGNFTPWLANSGSIALLGETLGMDLEVEAVEHWVGPFRADILARVADEQDHRVVIENQFGRTNHGHLGQILTYLAGIEHAKTVIWIAETIQPDHRAAIDWLNNHTDEDYSFFAIEIELWKIENSPPAPRFNVVAGPNDWMRQTRAAVRRVDEPDLAERHHVRLAYWASFATYLKSRNAPFQIRKNNKDHWNSFGIGTVGCYINAIALTERKELIVDLTCTRDRDRKMFAALAGQKDQIEQELGETLDWREMRGKKSWRLVLTKTNADPADTGQYEENHAWQLDKMVRFRKAFSARVKALAEHLHRDTETDE
jgi:hypothetical protein